MSAKERRDPSPGTSPKEFPEDDQRVCSNSHTRSSFKHAYSLERRRERYLIIYAWRIMEGQVPNICDPMRGGIRTKWHDRRGRHCVVPTVSNRASQAIQSLRYASFAIHAPRLFNILPAHVRNITGCSVDTFKGHLDRYLSTVPDEPQIAGYTAIRRADSNSILHMTQHATAQIVSMLEGPDNQTSQRRPPMVTSGVVP